MNKVILQGLSIIAAILFTYIALSKVKWLGSRDSYVFDEINEEKIGDMYWKSFSRTEKISQDTLVLNVADSLLNHILRSNKISEPVHLHILEGSTVNAFALPGRHLVVYTGLIRECDRQEALSGVMAHELAHLQLKHVMRTLIRELGLQVLISGGNTGSVRAAIKHLSSAGFSRRMEQEADMAGIEYLENARVSPMGMAEFFYKMAYTEHTTSEIAESWLSTHPERKERASYLLKEAKKFSKKGRDVVNKTTWLRLKSDLE